MTIKPLVELLDVKRKKRALPTVSEEIHSRVRRGNVGKLQEKLIAMSLAVITLFLHCPSSSVLIIYYTYLCIFFFLLYFSHKYKNVIDFNFALCTVAFVFMSAIT